MNPKVKKNRPIGTRITLGGKNKAARKVIRGNKPRGVKVFSDKSVARQDKRANKINTRRSDRAVRKGNVKTVTSQRIVTPASSTTVKGTPSSSKTVTGTKFVPHEVRAGSSKSFGKERRGAAPRPVKTGTRGQRLQAALAAGRAAEKETITFEGQTFASGKRVATSKVVTTPATPDKTTTTPAKTETVTSKVPQFKKFVPRHQRPRKTKKRSGGSTLRSTNARVQRVSVTGTKKKK